MAKNNNLIIGLLWHSVASNNLGVGALTLSNIRLITEECKKLDIIPQYILLGSKYDKLVYPEPYENYILDSEDINRRKLLDPRTRLHILIRQCQLIFDLGEGDSFSDIYGGYRFFLQSYSKFLCIIYRKPYVLAPQTLGPFNKALSKQIAKLLLRNSKFLFSRDYMSKEYVENMGLKKTELYTDVAFTLPFEVQNNRFDDTKVHVGINVSGLLYQGGYTKNNMFGLMLDYPALINRIIEYFIKQNECQVHLVSHVAYPIDSPDGKNIENDYLVCSELKCRYSAYDVVLEDICGTPVDAKNMISSYDIFIGSRMHACIAALSSGVPVIPVAYSRKFSGLFETIGYKHVADCCNEGIDIVYDKVIQGYEKRSELMNDLVISNSKANILLKSYVEQIAEILKNTV